MPVLEETQQKWLAREPTNVLVEPIDVFGPRSAGCEINLRDPDLSAGKLRKLRNTLAQLGALGLLEIRGHRDTGSRVRAQPVARRTGRPGPVG